jgi:16S rRNA processing protein RimM
LEEAAGSKCEKSDAGIIVLGKIVGPSGLRGAVKVFPFADDPLAWGKLKHWRIAPEGSNADAWKQTRVLRCRAQGELLVAELECLPDRNAAEAVHGFLVGVLREELPVAGKDEYYWADLVGLKVRNTQGEALGEVLGLIDTPANAVLRVGDGSGDEHLLPFVAAVVLEVDLEAREIRVDWGADW